ncbi:hypothetical protein CsNV_027 [Callinectes sapidus nudivirus]|nr:hypothetical protein CsNV_027 [Callinectes sapidus nudivirus]
MGRKRTISRVTGFGEEIENYLILETTEFLEVGKYRNTDISYRNAQIVQISGIILNANTTYIKSTFNQWIKPSSDIKISKKYKKYLELYKTQIENGQSFTVVFNKFLNWIKNTVPVESLTTVSYGDKIRFILHYQCCIHQIHLPLYIRNYSNIRTMILVADDTMSPRVTLKSLMFIIKLNCDDSDEFFINSEMLCQTYKSLLMGFGLGYFLKYTYECGI